MSSTIALKEAERKAFATTHQDGLWDFLLGLLFLMFAIAPLLSGTLGDFWSSAVFVPFWLFGYITVRVVRKRVVLPRMGQVRFGETRRRRIFTFLVVVTILNLAALALGFIAHQRPLEAPRLPSAFVGLMAMVGFSTAACFLDARRLYFYGFLVLLSLFGGEWLYREFGAPHHGYPITFGLTAGTMLLVGLTRFTRFLREHPLQPENATPGEACHG